MDYFISTGGFKKNSPNRYPFNRSDYIKTYKKIDITCGYNRSYAGCFEDEYNIGGMDHRLNMMAYTRNKSQSNLIKIQNPVHTKVCLQLIRFHKKEIQRLLN